MSSMNTRRWMTAMVRNDGLVELGDHTMVVLLISWKVSKGTKNKNNPI